MCVYVRAHTHIYIVYFYSFIIFFKSALFHLLCSSVCASVEIHVHDIMGFRKTKLVRSTLTNQQLWLFSSFFTPQISLVM